MLRNTTSFVSLDALDSSNSDYLVTSEDYAFYWAELKTYFQRTTLGVLTNPYTDQLFPAVDQEYFTKRLANEDVSLALSSGSGISITTLDTIYARLVVPLSEDYQVQTGFPATGKSLAFFREYLDCLPADEKRALEDTVVEWRRPLKKYEFEIKRAAFKDIFDSVSDNSLCHHLAAVYFWQLLHQLAPERYVDVPDRIKYTSTYWGGMLSGGRADEAHPKTMFEASTRPSGDRLNEFRRAYYLNYREGFFKNPWSTMKGQLDRNEIINFEQVLSYAERNPDSRTAEIIRRNRF